MNVSVVIPTWNRAKTLPRALDSVLAQRLPAHEIIVVDDGSSDETPELIASRYPRIVYLSQTNQGVSAARNRGIRAATGEWIALLDSDDEWLPSKLAEQARLLQAEPELRICHTEEIWIRRGRRVNPMKKHAKSGGDLFLASLPLCVISPSSVLLRRDLFEDYGLFDETLPACEDYDLWLRLCAHEKVGFVETPQIIKYGGHDDQLSRKHWGMDRFRVQALRNIIDHGRLAPEHRRAAIDMLVRKSAILAQGARKRGAIERADYYRQLQSRYRSRALS